MSDDVQLEERIRASLSHRAESIQVEPDLAGLADHAGPQRVRIQRYPLVAVAVVLAALAVTSVALGQGSRESNLITRSSNRTDRAEEPTSTTRAPDSTPEPKGPTGPNRHKSPSTTTPVPTSVQPPGDTTPPPVAGEAPDGGPVVVPAPVPPPTGSSCAQVEGEVIASTSWEGDGLVVVEYGRNATLRHLTIWRDPAGPDACQRRLQDTSGQPFGFSLPTPSGTPFESHTIRCSPPRFEFVIGYSDDDGVTWRFAFETYAVEGDTVSLVEEHDAEYVEPRDRDIIEALRQTSCGVAQSGG